MTRTLSAIVLSVAVLAAPACGGGRGWGPPGASDTDAPEPVTVVELAEVARGEVRDILLSSGTIEATASAELMPNAQGMVVSLHKDVGDAVKRGDLLAVVENVTLDASASRTRAEVKRLQTRLAELQALEAKGAASRVEVEDVAWQLTEARSRAREASRSFGETRITAPFAGVIASRDVNVGDMASPSNRVFQVVNLDGLHVRANLPERDVGRLKLGQPARLVSAYDPGIFDTARVTRISPVIDANTGTFQAILQLNPGPATLRPGQFVRIELEVDRREDVLVAPRSAVVYEDGAPLLWRVEPAPAPEEGDTDAPPEGSLIARRTPVTLGLIDARVAQIKGGIDEGMRVVAVGQDGLKEGAVVREAGAASTDDGADGGPDAASDDAPEAAARHTDADAAPTAGDGDAG